MSKILDPQAKALMDIVARAAAPAFHTLDVDRARDETRKLHAYFSPPAPQVAAVREIEIPGEGAAIAARLYRPRGSTAEMALPLLVFFHGGGWTVGDLDSYDPLCRTLANEACCAVLSVDYRLAPEHPFPAAVDDACTATVWASEHAEELDVDASRIAVGGDSAGGNLAAVTAILARDRGAPSVALQLLVYPATDQRTERPSWRQFGRGYLLDLESIRYFQNKYLRHARDYDDWRASPLRRTDLAGVAPALVITAGFDPLLDDCVAYADHLKAAGVAVEYHCFEGMVHGFLTLGKLFTAAGEATRLAAQSLTRAFQR
ncbi:MAG: alpha/beta hydrolase [Betaproteobacteria bacterium]|nr:alpha/beta hydrolase [Betaproteobacteria bacterium]